MITATFTDSLDGEMARLEPIRVGHLPGSLGVPDRCLRVVKDDGAILRVDVYAHGPDCFAFEKVMIWHAMVVVGFGSHVHAISTVDRSVATIELESYFAQFYATANYILVASGERLFRLESDRSILWKSERLGIDGVIVHDIGPSAIRGEGEWDPPGGRKPFAIDVADGRNAQQSVHS